MRTKVKENLELTRTGRGGLGRGLFGWFAWRLVGLFGWFVLGWFFLAIRFRRLSVQL